MAQPDSSGKMSATLRALGGGEACGARWTLGALLLAPLAAVNSSYCAVPAIILLSVFAAIASKWFPLMLSSPTQRMQSKHRQT